MSSPRSRVWVAVAAVTTSAAACLPRGAPPAGRQIVADREASLGAIVPPSGDGVLRILVLRPHPGGGAHSADLSVVSLDGDEDGLPERLLVSDIDSTSGLGCIWNVAPCSFDARGRIGVSRNGAAPVLVDPVTGQVTEQDTAFGIRSASGGRTFVPEAAGLGGPRAGTLIDPDGVTTAIMLAPPPTVGDLQDTVHYQFAGEDFYYLDPGNALIDVPASRQPQTVATGITNFTVSSTPDGPLFTLTRATADPAVRQQSIRDPLTMHETVLPPAAHSSLQFSPDWGWLLYGQSVVDGPNVSQAFTLFDFRTSASQALDLPAGAGNVQWRRAHDQIWASTFADGSASGIWILSPGMPPITVDDVGIYWFSADGNAWFSTSDFDSSTPATRVGVADDPTGPVFSYNPPGTAAQHEWVLADGRVMASFSSNDPQRGDVIAVDPRTGDRQMLAQRGLVAAVGQTRLMGMFNYEDGRGDLTAVDLQSGQRTTLAAEFAVTAFAEPQGSDLLAPGTRLVYQFQARTASPYDGLWLVSAP